MADGTDVLISKVKIFVREHMSRYDASHDYGHIERVLGLARHLTAAERLAHPDAPLNDALITLAVLLHDVGDRKYLAPGEDGLKLAYDALRSHGASSELADYVQILANHVSYSNENADPKGVQEVLKTHPELAVVQDADRLDSMGAVGIARVFTYGAAKTTRSMESSLEHVEVKLVKLTAMMKTAEGKRLGKLREDRLRMFQSWWNEERREEK